MTPKSSHNPLHLCLPSGPTQVQPPNYPSSNNFESLQTPLPHRPQQIIPKQFNIQRTPQSYHNPLHLHHPNGPTQVQPPNYPSSNKLMSLQTPLSHRPQKIHPKQFNVRTTPKSSHYPLHPHHPNGPTQVQPPNNPSSNKLESTQTPLPHRPQQIHPKQFNI